MKARARLRRPVVLWWFHFINTTELELEGHSNSLPEMQAEGSKGIWDEWMGIQLECQYEEDLTKQPEAGFGTTKQREANRDQIRKKTTGRSSLVETTRLNASRRAEAAAGGTTLWEMTTDPVPPSMFAGYHYTVNPKKPGYDGLWGTHPEFGLCAARRTSLAPPWRSGFEVLRCLHAIDATRGSHQTRVVSL